MDTKDIGLQLCAKDPIYVDGVPVYPVSLREIARVGYKRFNAEMRMLCLTESDIQMLTGKDISELGVFSFLVGSAISDAELMKMLLFWLSKITQSKVTFSYKRMCFTSGLFDITKDNFDDVQGVIRLRNGLKDINEEEENPENEAARRVLQRRKEERLKRKKAKEPDEESAITLEDLVSILASGLGMLMDTVMEYDLYHFNDQFNRLKIMDDYNVSVQALLHGAKKENVNLTHWITKIKKEQE